MLYSFEGTKILIYPAPEQDVKGGLIIESSQFDTNTTIGQINTDLIKGQSDYELPEDFKMLEDIQVLIKLSKNGN